jgi:hypothetical protein
MWCEDFDRFDVEIADGLQVVAGVEVVVVRSGASWT